MQSESIGKLAAALSKVQGELRGYSEKSDNPFFKSKYGSLTDVWAAIRATLAANKLSVSQTMGHSDGKNTLVTTLMHESGEWISGEMLLMADKPGMQPLGSAVTYARRYSLAAICGICPEDDDAEGATDHKPKSKPKAKSKPKGDRKQRQKAAQQKADEQAPFDFKAEFNAMQEYWEPKLGGATCRELYFDALEAGGGVKDSILLGHWLESMKKEATAQGLLGPNGQPITEGDVPF